MGVGDFGKKILRELLKVAQPQNILIRAVARSNYPTVAKNFAGTPGLTLILGEGEQLLKDPATRAVIIATQSTTHYELARKFLEAGKDVLVEKPMALNALQAQELVDLAERNGRILMVGHVLRYAPMAERVKRLIRSGELGKVSEIRAVFHKHKGSTSDNSTSALEDLAPHLLSLIHDWLGMDQPTEILKVQELSNKELIWVHMLYGNVNVFLTIDRERDGKPSREIKITGSDFIATFDHLANPHQVHIEATSHDSPLEKLPELRNSIRETGEPVELAHELAAFMESVKTRKEPLTSVRSELGVMRTIDAIKRKLRESGVAPSSMNRPDDPSGSTRHRGNPSDQDDEDPSFDVLAAGDRMPPNFVRRAWRWFTRSKSKIRPNPAFFTAA